MADLKWGSNQITWGSLRAVWGGDLPPFVAEDALAGFTFHAQYPDGSVISCWTGIGDLAVGGQTFPGIGPDIVQISSTVATGTSAGRMTISITDIDPAHRNEFLQDPGLVVVTVRLVYSDDGGVTWQNVARFFRGVISRPQLSGGIYTVEISTYQDELDRGYELTWSDEEQQTAYSGDKGFEHLKTIDDGVDFRWPP